MDTELKAQAETQAIICSVFANPRRVMILWSLAEKEKSVTEIAQAIGASLQSTSQHLNLMKGLHILESHREGKTVFYRITQNEILQGCASMVPEKSRSQHRIV